MNDELDELKALLKRKQDEFDEVKIRMREAQITHQKNRNEIYRLKTKCNLYAVRLVEHGVDDVSWEVTNA
jgi:hypothetical protein